jgi:hypothetical protein
LKKETAEAAGAELALDDYCLEKEQSISCRAAVEVGAKKRGAVG